MDKENNSHFNKLLQKNPKRVFKNGFFLYLGTKIFSVIFGSALAGDFFTERGKTLFSETIPILNIVDLVSIWALFLILYSLFLFFYRVYTEKSEVKWVPGASPGKLFKRGILTSLGAGLISYVALVPSDSDLLENGSLASNVGQIEILSSFLAVYGIALIIVAIYKYISKK